VEALILLGQVIIMFRIALIYNKLEDIERKLPDSETLVQSKEFWKLFDKTVKSIQQTQQEIARRVKQLREEREKGTRKGKVVELDPKEEV